MILKWKKKRKVGGAVGSKSVEIRFVNLNPGLRVRPNLGIPEDQQKLIVRGQP
jgi:hypothetical protein